MDYVSDILLGGGAIAAAIYCLVLSRKLTSFSKLEGGVGGAIAGLAAQVEDMTKLLEQAQATAKTSSSSLEGLTGRAEGVAERLEIMLAAMHDLPDEPVNKNVRRLRIARRRSSRLMAAE